MKKKALITSDYVTLKKFIFHFFYKLWAKKFIMQPLFFPYIIIFSKFTHTTDNTQHTQRMYFGSSNDDNSSSNNSSNGLDGLTGFMSNTNSNNGDNSLFTFPNEDSNEDLYPRSERERGTDRDRETRYGADDKVVEELRAENERLKSELLEAKSVRQEYFRLFQENKYLIDKMHELELSYLNKLSNANQKIKALQAQLDEATAASQQIQSNWIQVAENLPNSSSSSSSPPSPSSPTSATAERTASKTPSPDGRSSSHADKMVVVCEDNSNNNNSGNTVNTTKDKDNDNDNDEENDDSEPHFSEPGTPQTQKSTEFFSQEYDQAKKKIMRAMSRMQEVERMREELRKTKSSLADLEYKHTSSQRASAGKAQENERLNTILEGQNTLIEILSAAKKDLEKSLAERDLEVSSLKTENAKLFRRINDFEAKRAEEEEEKEAASDAEKGARGNREAEEALRNELASEKRAAAELKSEYDGLNEECLRQEQEIKQLREDLEILNAKKESSERIACTLTKEFLAFRKTVEARCESSQQEASQAEAERNTLRDENARLASRAQERADEIARLRAENTDLRERAQAQAAATDASAAAAEKERAGLVAELDSLKHKCEMLQKLAESTIQKEEHTVHGRAEQATCTEVQQQQQQQQKSRSLSSEAQVLPVATDTPAAAATTETPKPATTASAEPSAITATTAAVETVTPSDDNGLRPSSSVVFNVMLSGFKDTATRKRVTGELTALGCSIVVSEKELAAVTHLVVPSLETRTLKVVSAALTGKWVVTDKWAAASTEAGFCVREESFGFKVSQSPILGKRVFFSQDFAKDTGRLRSALAIIKVGRATRVLTPEDADIFLAHDLTAESFNAAAASFVAFDWPGFIEMLLKPDVQHSPLKRKNVEGSGTGDSSVNKADEKRTSQQEKKRKTEM